MREAEVKIANLSEVKQPSSGSEEISWKTLYQDKKLSLKIKGRINQSEQQLKQICVLSVVGKNEFYVRGVLRNNENTNESTCQKSSIASLKTNGTWNFEYDFPDQNDRTIRVEKIYKNNSALKSYIDFTIRKNY